MQKKLVTFMVSVSLILALFSSLAMAKDKVIELTIQDPWSDVTGMGAVWVESLKAFEDANPDIKIKRTQLPMAQNIERIMMQTITQSLPDIVGVDTQDVPHLVEMGALLDLSPYVAEWDFWEDDIFQGSKDATSWNGKPHSFQFTTNCIAIHYNVDMFEAAGLTRAPETWDELLEYAIKLTTDDVYGLSISFIDTETATWDYIPFLWSNGGDLLDLDTPEAVEALEFIVSLLEHGVMSPDVVNWTSNDTALQFQNGDTAMIMTGPWEIPGSIEAGINFEIAPVPVPEKGMKSIVAVGGETFGISAFAPPEKIEAALRLFSWMMSEEGMMQYNATVNNIPTRISVAEQLAAENPTLCGFVDQYQHAVNRFTAGGGTKYTEVSIATRQAIQKALIGAATPAEALKEAAAEIEKIMND